MHRIRCADCEAVLLGDHSLDRDKAYALLAQELERLSCLPRQDLVRCIGEPRIERTEWVGAEPLTIEVRVEWAEAEAGAIRIRATANGPSCWRFERLEEAVVIDSHIEAETTLEQ